MSAPGRRWALILGAAAFIVLAPPSLLGLPFAALVAASGPTRRSEWSAVGLTGGPSLLLLALPTTSLLASATRAYVLIVTAAFLAGVLAAPGRFLRQAVRATAVAGVLTVALGAVAWGPGFGDALRWEVTREAGAALRLVVQQRPEIYPAYEPAVRAAAAAFPAVVALQTLAALALAWQWHHRVVQRPLGAPLGPLREFRMGDAWVWAVVGALAVWLVPWLGALRAAAANLALVASVLYLLRGAAVVAAVASAAAVPAAALAVAGALAAALVVPLVFVVPVLWTLGVSDTWLEFRRRLGSRPTATRG